MYKYKEKDVLLDYEIFTIPKKIKKSILTKTAINNFMKNYVKKNCKQGTVKNYNSIFKMHILPAFGNRKLNDISIEDIKSFYIECKNINKFICVYCLIDYLIDWAFCLLKSCFILIFIPSIL